MMHKARDHNGYGLDGIVDRRDLQVTAVSEDAPGWMIGTRTLSGPLWTKKNPVRRCPFVHIDGKNLKIQARTYAQGPGLSCIEQMHDRSTPPTPARVIRAPRYDDMENKAERCNLELGGCQARAPWYPRSEHVCQETFVPPKLRTLQSMSATH